MRPVKASKSRLQPGAKPVLPTKTAVQAQTAGDQVDVDRLLKADKVTLVATAEKDGKVRVACASWDIPTVVLPGQVLELRWHEGLVMVVKRAKDDAVTRT